MAQPDNFRELIKPGTNFEFMGKIRLWFTISILLVVASIAMLPINHAIRGSILNWTIDFKGGTEIVIKVADAKVGAGAIRNALQGSGHKDVDVSSYVFKEKDGTKANGYLVRLAEFGAVKKADADKISADLSTKFPDKISKARWSGDVLYVRSSQPFEAAGLTTEKERLASATTALNGFFGGEEPKFEVKDLTEKVEKVNATTYEYEYQVTVNGLSKLVETALTQKLGTQVTAVQSEGVGAKAGKELRDDGIKSLLYAIALIMLYIAFRFDFRYGPGTVASLLHDAIITVGVFAVLWVPFSLTTVAAVLTVIGYSMNDTVVVFDRIRENEARLKDKKFDRVINISVNETLSRTILTSLTTFLVTLCMNLLGTGLVKNFAFAMNIGIVVGTYSSIFVAAPVLLWLNEKYFAKRPATGVRRGRIVETEPA